MVDMNYLDANLIQIMQESELEGERSSKKRLEEAKKNGLDVVVWNIYNHENANIPVGGRILKRNFKRPKEPIEDYILRLMEFGKLSKKDDLLIIQNKIIALIFDFKNKGIESNDETVDFYRGMDESKKIEGVVNLRKHNYELIYKSMLVNYPLQASGINKPNEVIFHIGEQKESYNIKDIVQL